MFLIFVFNVNGTKNLMSQYTYKKASKSSKNFKAAAFVVHPPKRIYRYRVSHFGYQIKSSCFSALLPPYCRSFTFCLTIECLCAVSGICISGSDKEIKVLADTTHLSVLFSIGEWCNSTFSWRINERQPFTFFWSLIFKLALAIIINAKRETDRPTDYSEAWLGRPMGTWHF